MPSLSSPPWRLIPAVLVTGALLAAAPPVLPRGVPDTVLEVVPIDGRRVAPASAIAAPGDGIRLKRAAWTRSTRVCAPFTFTMVGLVWRQPGDDHVLAHLSWTGASRGAARVESDPHDAPDAGSIESAGLNGTPPVWTGESRCVRFRMLLPRGEISRLRAVFINSSGAATPRPSWAATTQPRIITRAEWGANEARRRCGPFYADRLRMAYLHHTATGNGYGRDRADDVIRGIYAYHTRARGFCDIAYNFLVDRFGRVYEGRFGGIDQPVIGGHAMGFNTGSAGIAALGNFQVAHPPKVVVAALKRLVAWRLDAAHVSPVGYTLMTSGGGPSQKYREGQTVALRTVVAHRRTGYTNCPGRLFRLLGGIRRAAAEMGLPKIYDAAQSASGIVTASTFARYTATLSEPLPWSVDVTDALGQRVRSFSGSGPAVDATWDGRNGTGTPVPDGTYTVTISAGPTPDGRTATPAAFSVKVCAVPPAPALSGPTPTPSPSPAPAAGPTPAPGPCG